MNSIKFKEKAIAFDLVNNLVIIESVKYQLSTVWNEKILNAIDKKQIIIGFNENIIKDKKPLYYCARKIKTVVDENGENYYLDILLYKDYKDTYVLNYVNRSIGHRNDFDEKEIHQVLNGSILEIIIKQEKLYIKILSKGEFVEIPSGTFHCTYILEPNTVVANIYSNVFWEKDITLKPYFNVINDISILEIDNNFYLQKGLEKIKIDKKHKFIEKNGFHNYNKLYSNLYFTQMYNLNYDIFDLLMKIKKFSN